VWHAPPRRNFRARALTSPWGCLDRVRLEGGAETTPLRDCGMNQARVYHILTQDSVIALVLHAGLAMCGSPRKLGHGGPQLTHFSGLLRQPHTKQLVFNTTGHLPIAKRICRVLSREIRLRSISERRLRPLLPRIHITLPSHPFSLGSILKVPLTRMRRQGMKPKGTRAEASSAGRERHSRAPGPSS